MDSNQLIKQQLDTIQRNAQTATNRQGMPDDKGGFGTT